MKKMMVLLAIHVLVSHELFSQTSAGIVSGTVLNTSNSPVEAATISLLKTADSSLIKISITDKNGKFSFQQIPVGKYYINVSAINYTNFNSGTLELSNTIPVTTMNALILQPATKLLGTVTVTTKKALIEQKPDRMIINVDAAVTNTGTTALELLEKSPGVTVDKDGNISLKGKPNVMIMIDGKASYLGGAELANLLSNMNSNQLSQIEIMTNPSAKYDASGNAGVINIKTKKSLTQGLNGNITMNYGQGVYPKINNSIMLNYRTGNINAFINYGYMLNKGFMNINVQRNFIDSTGKKTYELDHATHLLNQSQNNNLKLGLDYLITPATSLGFVVTGFVAPQNQDAFTTAVIKDGNNNLTSIEKTTRKVDNTWKNGTFNINFHTSADSNKKDFTGNIDYLHYDFAGNQQVSGLTYDANEQLLASSYLKNIVPLTIDVYSLRFDYAQSFISGIKMEMGVKSSLVKTNNSSLFYKESTDDSQPDASLSNVFSYSENINAAYINLNKTFGKWTIQGGLRAENSNYKGDQISYNGQQDSSFSRSYTSLFPTAFVSYELNNNHRFTVSAGRRIDRPAYQQLNPFTAYIDKYMRSAGNPYLQPQFSNNFELSHTYKNRYTTTLNYSVIHSMMNETLIHQDSVIIRSVGNIGTRYNFGIAESASIPFTKWYTGIFYANLYQNEYNGEVNGFKLNAKQVTLELYINNQFSFSKGWSAELSGTYASRNRDEGQALSLPIGQVSAGFAKQLWSNKASIKFNVRDIFCTQISKEIQNFQDVQSTLERSRDTRVLNIAFVYRFGMPSKSKTAQATDEQKRIPVN